MGKVTESEGIFVYHFSQQKVDLVSAQAVAKKQLGILERIDGALDLVHPLLLARAKQAKRFS